MPGRPEYRRFGFVDFDAMGAAVAGDLDPTDEIVIRQAEGSNVVAAISQLPFTAIPDPLLLSDGSAAAPSYSFASEPNTGMYYDSLIKWSSIGTEFMRADDTGLLGPAASAPTWYLVSDESASAVNPIYVFNNDNDTGLGTAGEDQLSFIAGAVEGLRLTELNDGVIQAPDATLAITAFAGGGQADAVALITSYNVLSTVATAADSVKLPATFAINSIAYVKNDGAEAADIFPASGDNLGAGVNTAISIPAGEARSFIATAANATWTQLLPSAGGISFPILAPDGSAAAPSYSFSASGQQDLGIYRKGTDNIGITVGANGDSFEFVAANSGTFQADDAAGPFMRNVASSSIAANIGPNKGDTNTGMGSEGDDILNLIAGARTGVKIVESGFVTTVTIGNDNSATHKFLGAWSATQGAGPAMLDEAATSTNPTLVPNQSDPDTGIGWGASLDELILVAGGVEAISLAESGGGISLTMNGPTTFKGTVKMEAPAGPSLLNTSASSSVPTVNPNQADPDTGIGRDTVDGLALIAGGVDCFRVREIGGARAIGCYTTTPIVQQTGVAVDAAGIHAACVALGLFTA